MSESRKSSLAWLALVMGVLLITVMPALTDTADHTEAGNAGTGASSAVAAR